MTEHRRTEPHTSAAEVPPLRLASRKSRSEGSWRTVEMFVPTDLTHDKFTDYIHTHIRGIAHDGGEFIQRIAVDSRVAHSLAWWRCSVAYLPGPPGTLQD